MKLSNSFIVIGQKFDPSGWISNDLDPKSVHSFVAIDLINIIDHSGNKMVHLTNPNQAIRNWINKQRRSIMCFIRAFVGRIHIYIARYWNGPVTESKSGISQMRSIIINGINNLNELDFARYTRQIVQLVIKRGVPICRKCVEGIFKLKVGSIENIKVIRDLLSLQNGGKRRNKRAYNQPYVFVLVPFTLWVIVFLVGVTMLWAGYGLITEGFDRFSKGISRRNKWVPLIGHLVAGLGLIIGGLELLEHYFV